jgi:hypothetical protein
MGRTDNTTVEQRYSGSSRHANSTSKLPATQTQPMHEAAEMPISIGCQNRTEPPNSPPGTHARKEPGNARRRDAPCCRPQQRRRAGTARTPPPPPARTPSLPCPRLRLRSAVPPATAAAAFGSAQSPEPIWHGGG